MTSRRAPLAFAAEHTPQAAPNARMSSCRQDDGALRRFVRIASRCGGSPRAREPGRFLDQKLGRGEPLRFGNQPVMQSQSDLVDSRSVSEPAGCVPAPAIDAGRRSGIGVRARTAALRAGLIACFLILAASPPNAAWHRSARAMNAGHHQRTETLARLHTCSKLTIPVAARVSADDLFLRRDIQYRTVELQLLERRYALLGRGQRHLMVRRRRHHVLASLVQYQHWLDTLAIGGDANGAAPLMLASNDVEVAPFEEPDSILMWAATFRAMPVESFTWTVGGLPVSGETGAIELSGGAISDTDKVTVEANGGLQLSFTPNWSLIAKFNGEVRPQPQLYAGSATLNYIW